MFALALVAMCWAGCNAIFGVDDLEPITTDNGSSSSAAPSSAQASSGQGGRNDAGGSASMASGVGGTAGGGGQPRCRHCNDCLIPTDPCLLEEMCGYNEFGMSCEVGSSCALAKALHDCTCALCSLCASCGGTAGIQECALCVSANCERQLQACTGDS